MFFKHKASKKYCKRDNASDTLILFIIMLFFVIPFFFVSAVWLKTGHNPFTYDYSEEQLIALVSGVFSYCGTSILGFIALLQNIRLKKEINKDRQQELAIKTLADQTMENFEISYNNISGTASDSLGNNFLSESDKNFDNKTVSYDESLVFKLKFESNGIKFLKGIYIKQITFSYDFLAGKDKVKRSEDIVFKNIFTNNYYKNIASIIDINNFKNNIVSENDKSDIFKYKNKKLINKLKSVFTNKESQELFFDINYTVCNMYNLKYDGLLKIQCKIDENLAVSNFVTNSNSLSEPYFNTAVAPK